MSLINFKELRVDINYQDKILNLSALLRKTFQTKKKPCNICRSHLM